jgi:dihydroorotate dehydrogenase electron transfer subunit
VPGAGEYVLADFGGPIREPLFPSALSDAGFKTVVSPGHPATRLLPGAKIDVLGPLGRGFRLAPAGYPLARLLLIAQVEFLPLLNPLYQAAPSVVLVVEATTRAQLPPPSRFPPTLELVLVTLDGSAGYLGPLAAGAPWGGTASRPTCGGPGWERPSAETSVGLERISTRLRELIAWAECICIAHDTEAYPALARLVKDVRLQPLADFAQALVRVPMPCGVGACDVCGVATRRGESRVCVEGPVLDLLDFLR